MTRNSRALDTTFDSLRSPLRRDVLRVLRERPSGVELDALAEELAVRRAGDASADSADPAAVERSLFHVHLPKLADAGIAAYDREDGRVTAGERFSDAVELLSAVRDRLAEAGVSLGERTANPGRTS